MGSRGVNPEECEYLKIETKGKLKDFKMRFSSLSEIQMFLRDNPDRNREVFAESASETAPEAFAGAPLKQAIKYCIGGYEDRFEEFLRFARELEAHNVRFANERYTETSVVGQRPNVPAYVAGAPKTMYRLKRAQEKKNINIFMNVSYPASSTEEQIRNRGIVTLNLIRILERNGYIVNFRVFEYSMNDYETFLCEVVLKKPGEQLDSRKCYYPMCGKSFVRRIMARIKESMPFESNWGLSYGKVMKESAARRALKAEEGDIYIGAPLEMNIMGNDLYADADAFLDKLNIRDKIVVPRYKLAKD